MSAARPSEADVDVPAHRDSYPMGNTHHGTEENPEWGTFCVECKQSWPCDVSILAAALADLRGEIEALDRSGRMSFDHSDLRALLLRDDAAGAGGGA